MDVLFFTATPHRFLTLFFVPRHYQKLFDRKNLYCYIIVHICSFWDTVSLHATYNFSHKHGAKDVFLGLKKMPPSWSFHSMREPFCLTKPFGTVAHKELLWAALALITWLSGPQDIDPEPFFLVTPKVLQFLCEMEWYLKGTQAYWTCPKWW